MDKNSYLFKLNEKIPGVVLESKPFGRSGILSIWVEAKGIGKVAELLKSEFQVDYLENFSVIELDGTLVVSYFLRTSDNAALVLRVSLVPKSKDEKVEIPSVQEIWPMAEPMEKEAGELFGIGFKKEKTQEDQVRFLAQGWEGFPLRKSYVFPSSYAGIPHSPRFNSSQPKMGSS